MSLIEDIEEYLPYLHEENRLKTYKTWVFSKNKPCNVDKMAEAGFIFIGNKQEPDAVKCFFCWKNLDGWEESDNPWKEHLKHAPVCSFAKLQQAQTNITLKQFIDLRHELLSKIVKYYKDIEISELTSIVKKVESRLKK
ncbi:baculoviral IAP repeat-containing protein 5 [Diabrotica virgifera virgifera]|uniref:Baculoviral IAP repeat-containing protein 5 n=1 Tax=Diabrotica virgifera virgifera TaxID=50390 RepID=A0A6P7FYA9_DIAVI|nr:baculoviral IAP repeat-containing protein 5 [Diabrotica virgifera virgifera]